jgi:L-ribulokinase
MQITADVLNRPIKVVSSEQTCALGSAMAAATVAGIYNSIEKAQLAMGSGFEETYEPIPENAEQYARIYKKYVKLGKFIEDELTA